MQSHLSLSLLLILSAGAASAQEFSPFKPPFSIHEKKFGITGLPGAILPADTVDNRLRQLFKARTATNLLAEAKLSHETALGKVYIMPYDNMRCLVPDIKKSAPMPTMRRANADPMPNLYRSSPKVRTSETPEEKTN